MDTPLANIDLNLLVAFRTLLEERSVTKAAERLFITQPAMSKTLQRLRELFNDELFTRSSRGLVPTPRAQALEHPLQQALEFLESNIFGTEFDPSTASGEIHICGPEMFSMTTIPELATILANSAPGVTLRSRNLLDDYLELLAHGSLDFAIYIDSMAHGPDYATYPILSGSPSVWLPATHPLAHQEAVFIKELAGLPSVSVYMPGFSDSEMSVLQDLFRSKGVELSPMLQTTQLMIALEIICLQGAFMLGPNVLSDYALAQNNVVSVPIADADFEEQVKLELVLIQHQRTLNSALHTWVREELLALVDRYVTSH